MFEILVPFKIDGLLMKPEFSGRIKMSEDIQQTLASLVGYDEATRRMLRCSEGGVFYVTSPRLKNIVHITANDDAYDWQGSDEKVTEIMVMGHPDNSGLVWVKNDEAATTNNGWPLAAKEILGVTVENLNNLHLLIASTGEKAILLYTR